MSSYSRRFALLAPLALAACGFEPVYAPGGTGDALRNQVLIATPTERNSYLLVQRLEEQLGRSTAPRYTLSLNVTTSEQGLGTDANGTINRFNLIGVASYALTDGQSGAVVTSGTVNSFTGFSTTGSTTVTFAARRDAQARLMVILGDQMVARLLATPLPQ